MADREENRKHSKIRIEKREEREFWSKKESSGCVKKGDRSYANSANKEEAGRIKMEISFSPVF